MEKVENGGAEGWMYDLAIFLQMKKQHPCGGKEFLGPARRHGFKIRCTTCGHEIMVPRLKCEKNIKKILRENTGMNPSAFARLKSFTCKGEQHDV